MQHSVDAESVARELQLANERLLVSALREQQQAEQAKRSAAEIAALLESMTEGVTVFDASGQVVSMNPCGRKLLGLGSTVPTVDDFRRLDLRDLTGAPVDFDRDILSRMLRQERFTDEEMIILTPRRAPRAFMFSGSAVPDDGRAALAIMVFRDITPLRELEQLREQYLALISHDLRGPLTAARMAAELVVQQSGEAPNAQRLAARIIANLNRTDAMLRDLLDAQRIRAGQELMLKPEPTDLATLARDVVEELNTVYGDRLRLSGEQSVRGVWSAGDVRRALWNLASNAIKYGEADREVTVDVRARGDRVTLAVHNHGRPIAPEEISRLFTPYRQTASAAASGPGGWGLGLTLVRGCAEAHGGHVGVQSDAATGTTFIMELPRAPTAGAVIP